MDLADEDLFFRLLASLCEVYMRELPDGRRIEVQRITYGRARLHLTPPGPPGWYAGTW